MAIDLYGFPSLLFSSIVNLERRTMQKNTAPRLTAFVILLGALYASPCSAQTGPPQATASYNQTGPVNGYVTENIDVFGPPLGSQLVEVAYTVTFDPVTRAATYTPYGNPVTLTPKYITNNGVQFFTGYFTGSGTLASGNGTTYMLATWQWYNGAYYQVAQSTMFTP